MTKIKVRELLYVLLGLLFMWNCQSCRTNEFQKGGYFFQDVDRYFNLKDINVWVYSDFKPYFDYVGGVKLDEYYEKDIAVLKEIKLDRKKRKVLFTVVAQSKPQYHLIAIKHEIQNVDISNYDRKSHNGAYYFQRDFTMGEYDIRHAYIPFDKSKALSLVYYIRKEAHQSCPFCKFNYLVNINAGELQVNPRQKDVWQVFDCYSETSTVQINPPTQNLGKSKLIVLKVFAVYGENEGISYVRLFNNGKMKPFEIKLCPNKYRLEYSNEKHQLLASDSLTIK